MLAVVVGLFSAEMLDKNAFYLAFGGHQLSWNERVTRSEPIRPDDNLISTTASGAVASLAAQPVDEMDYKADLELLDRFQGVSAELIRLSLLGIGVLGFLLRGTIDAKSRPTWLQDKPLGVAVGISALLFAISAFAGLLHRYYSADGFYYHIKEARLRQRDGASSSQAVRVAKKRNWRYSLSGKCLFVSSVALGLGGFGLAAGLGRLLWLLARPT